MKNLLFMQKLQWRVKVYDYSSFRMKFMKLFVTSRFSRFVPIIFYNFDYLISYREGNVLR